MKLSNAFLFVILFSIQMFGQDKIMDLSVYDDWKSISEKNISNNGDWVVYVISPHKGDSRVHIYNTRNQRQYSFDRGNNIQIDNNNEFVAFMIKPHQDSIRHFRRTKVKEEDFPNDTLGIYYFNEKRLEKIPNVNQFKMPSKWGGIMVYEKLPITENIDSVAHANLVKEHNKENGTHYLIRNGNSKNDISILYCKRLIFSDKEGRLLYQSTGNDTINQEGLYIRDMDRSSPIKLIDKKGDYSMIGFSESGNQVSFIADFDTTKTKVRPFEIWMYDIKKSTLKMVANDQSKVAMKNWLISGTQKPYFSKDENSLFFGLRKKPILQDTSILDDEIVNVEVWSSNDKLLHTQQEVRLDAEKAKSYLAVYDIKNNKSKKLASEQYDQIRKPAKDHGKYILGIDEKPYQEYISWLGYAYKNLALINKNTGEKQKIMQRIDGYPSMSPSGKYVYWYSREKREYQVYNIEKEKNYDITNDKISIFHNEKHDAPSDPWPYGFAGWSEEDEIFYAYDRYDIWKIDPSGRKKAKRLTQGREKDIKYRYISLDEDLDDIPSDTTLLVYVFNEVDKSTGYGMLDLETGEVDIKLTGDYAMSSSPLKAKDSDDIVFSKENFDIFPDLIHSTIEFSKEQKISDANPQQKEYGWGSIELIKWAGKNGKPVSGLLVKPPNFDPAKKYPLLVNFYEKSSDRLHRHRAPYAHRSTINYSYYANQGYVIFNPDVAYTIGYPGQSALDAVMSGVDAVLEMGFVDETKMGLQGHSWGGYQVAHILTKTGRFACAESGAPVVNMTSAYGGIRWRSGMSRMFQYEKTQSRLGATLWEKPELYLENSPLFNLDQMTTPVLILHNDKDGAVPWYQGIEYFVALRRLNKEAWLLNYNNEPHWPKKRQNRIDFNTRMQQFFDHYLKGSPLPKWMLNGVPAIDKGINQGLEYLGK